MDQAELIFVPFPLPGHLPSTLAMAKLLTHRDPRLSITVLLMNFPYGPVDGLVMDSDSSIRCLTLPPIEVSSGATHPRLLIMELIRAYVPIVNDAVRGLTRSNSVQLAGFVIDMFCPSMVDCADEFGVPSYVFSASSAAFFGFLFHIQFLHDNEGLDIAEFKDSDAQLEIPSFANPVPGKVFPSYILDKQNGGTDALLLQGRRFRRVQGIIVNTFTELESHAIQSFSDSKTPPLYPVGPILNTQMESGGDQKDAGDILTWLDQHPPSSVVFLCFGSMGCVRPEQIKEIADGLERSGHRFLWSLRQPPPKDKIQFPSDYRNMEEVLPEGFLDRTAGIGKVMGWAPQVAVLAHSAVGGFVSHCGWNSSLESIWYGVPVAAWPMYGEQQLNAFHMVKDLELAVEIKMDYQRDGDYVVRAHEIENRIRELMDMDSEVRRKRKEVQKLSREAVADGGSSSWALGHFIGDMMANIPWKHHSDDS